jgi:uncharacterized cupin superfamily protein
MPKIIRRTSSLGPGCFLQGLGLLALLGAIVTLLTIIGPVVLGALGLWLILYGASISEWHECSDCGTRLSRRALKLCPNCKGAFPPQTTFEVIGLTPSVLVLGVVLAVLGVPLALVTMSNRDDGSGRPSKSSPPMTPYQEPQSASAVDRAVRESSSPRDSIPHAGEVAEGTRRLLLDAVEKALSQHEAKVAGTPTVLNIEAGKSWFVNGECSIRDGSSVHFESLVRLLENGDYQSVSLILEDDVARKNAPVDSVAPQDVQPKSPTESIPQEPTTKTSSRDNRPSVRTWTSADGKFSTEAEFQGLLAGKVKLRRVDGSTINIDDEKLSEADRKWIRSGRRK